MLHQRTSREEISDGLYDDSHRVLRYVHVWTEMASIPGEKMRCLATLCRGEYRSVFLGNRLDGDDVPPAIIASKAARAAGVPVVLGQAQLDGAIHKIGDGSARLWSWPGFVDSIIF